MKNFANKYRFNAPVLTFYLGLLCFVFCSCKEATIFYSNSVDPLNNFAPLPANPADEGTSVELTDQGPAEVPAIPGLAKLEPPLPEVYSQLLDTNSFKAVAEDIVDSINEYNLEISPTSATLISFMAQRPELVFADTLFAEYLKFYASLGHLNQDPEEFVSSRFLEIYLLLHDPQMVFFGKIKKIKLSSFYSVPNGSSDDGIYSIPAWGSGTELRYFLENGTVYKTIKQKPQAGVF
jgi:hypothetical protein